MNPRRDAGFTWIEAIVAVAIIGVLIALALPAIVTCGCSGPMTRSLSNLKQLHLATQSMEMDGVTRDDTNLGWPGDTGGTFTNWVAQLVPSYLGTNDFCKLLSAPGVTVPAGKIPTTMSLGAVLVYAVSSNSTSDTVFLTTANFTNGPQDGKPLEASAKPFGDKGFVVFRKGGDGAILLKNQATNSALIGKYVPLLK